ncbi:biotin/lipoyl-binding protein [Polynucleobacter sp. AP-Sanab-80-C2]|jgi:RND family efflux transporter MFP subunit|uniref:HlyD family secretion protein n=1 Tax=Polynucleobacter sp. AP-Sanab-80-C2 TaxID=3108274 RepID=UPI002B235DDB|nr:biotin/lipoyl-binding protein [Polynucleobacter sp. AP-Sanab-80-C2]MEA9599228.1 biotin/lipoyl-binding protein [Polynucleobacter sp. AP-Sanab-80-C2]
MEALILGIYAGIVWLIFFKYKLLPWNAVAKVIVFTIPVVGMITLILLLNIFSPSSSNVVVVRNSVGIVSQVKGRVTEVPVTVNQRVKKGDVLFKIDPTQYQASVNALKAKLKLAKLRVKENEALVKSGSGNRFDLEKAQADLAELSEQTIHSEYDLEQTVVRAPSDGTVVNVQLRPGAFVAAFPIASVMTFMEDTPQIYALFNQNELHQIEVGNEAEFYIPSFPGKILKAKVESIILAEGQGQIGVSGNLPTTGLREIPVNRFAVKLLMDDRHAELLLPAGAVGDGAVYTDHLAFLHIIRKVMLRISTKLNYIIPKLH